MSGETIKDYTDERIKHLEMIQGAIARYSDFSARLRNLAIVLVWTISLGFLGLLIGEMSIVSIISDFFGAKKTNGVLGFKEAASVAFAFYILTVILLYVSASCVLLDMHYHRRREEFREFYERVRAQPSGQRSDFCMTVPPDIVKMIRKPRVAIRKVWMPALWFYVTLPAYYSFPIWIIILIIFLWDKVW